MLVETALPLLLHGLSTLFCVVHPPSPTPRRRVSRGSSVSSTMALPAAMSVDGPTDSLIVSAPGSHPALGRLDLLAEVMFTAPSGAHDGDLGARPGDDRSGSKARPHMT